MHSTVFRKSTLVRGAFFGLIALLLVTAIPAVVGAQGSDGPQAVSQVASLNVRSGPAVSYAAISTLKKGQALPIVGRNAASGWWQVQLADGRKGWVTGQPALVKAEGDVSKTPEVAAPPRPAAARPSGRGGTIVFQTSSGGPIYIANGDGSGLRQLTTGIDPALSPDGKQVAFTRWESSSPGTLGSVWVINTDGSGERKVHSEIRQPKSPTWSPDGKSLMVNMQQGGQLEPYCYCMGWSDWRQGECPRDPPTLPDGSTARCFVDLGRAGWSLRLIDVATGQGTDQKRDFVSRSPTWDPINAWHVVFRGDNGLVNLDVNRQATWPLTNDNNDRDPSFSADGKKLAVTYRQHDHWDVHTMNAGGDGRVRITETPWSVTAAGKPVWNNASPAWSPDGKKIAFVTDRNGRWELWTMNADGSNAKSLFSPEVQASLNFQYNSQDERMVSWR